MSVNKLDIILSEINDLEKSNDTAIPKWARALITCFKGLIEELRGVNKLTKKIEELENIKKNQTKANNELETENFELKRELASLKTAYGNEECRSKHYTVLLQIILFVTMILTVVSFVEGFTQILYPAII